MPPNKQTLERLEAQGFDRQAVLQALVEAAGSEPIALQILRSQQVGSTQVGTQVGSTQAKTVAVAQVGQPVNAQPVSVEATVAPSGRQTMTQKLLELDEARDAGVITMEEYEAARAGILGIGAPAPITSQPGIAPAPPRDVRLRLVTRDGRGLALVSREAACQECIY